MLELLIRDKERLTLENGQFLQSYQALEQEIQAAFKEIDFGDRLIDEPETLHAMAEIVRHEVSTLRKNLEKTNMSTRYGSVVERATPQRCDLLMRSIAQSEQQIIESTIVPSSPRPQILH